ncbi:MAG: hypothetical protein AAF367_13470 [Pseudomonadota bacterium]
MTIGCSSPVAGTGTTLTTLNGPSAADLLTIGAAPLPPRLVAADVGDVNEISASAAALSAEQLAQRRGFRQIQISAIPYLRASPAGATFLSRTFPRALSRGEPASACPASMASSADVLTTRAAARDALGGCLAQLTTRGADSSCGCRLIAVNDFLLAPQADFTFAPSVSALLIRPDGSAERIVAESLRPDGDTELVSLRDVRGEIGRLVLSGERAAMQLLIPAEVSLTGERTIFGYRRGRLAERVTLTTPTGDLYKLLIGVELRDAVAPR